MDVIGDGNSAVVLMHDRVQSARIEAAGQNSGLHQIIRLFQSKGYQFVRMDECYNGCNGASVCAGNGGPTPFNANVVIPRSYIA